MKKGENDEERGEKNTDVEEYVKKEDVREIFNVKKGKEEKIVENKEIEEVKKVTKEQEENKQLKRIFFVIGAFVLFFVVVLIFINSVDSFEYKGIDFEIDKKTISGKTIYKTFLPVDSKSKVTGKAVFANYNFYFRKDPRKLEDLPLKGELTLMKDVVMNFTGDFNCDGDGIIAVANIVNVLNVLDVKAVKDETVGCDPNGAYTFLQLQTSDKTSIEQFGPSCYNLNINNCEVLEVTEKYLVELISEINKNL